MKNCDRASCYDYSDLEGLMNDSEFQKEIGIKKFLNQYKNILYEKKNILNQKKNILYKKKFFLNEKYFLDEKKNILNENDFLNEENFKWERCNRNFMSNLKMDSVLNLRSKLNKIKNKMKIYLLHGEKDLISNFEGIFEFSNLFFGKFKEKIFKNFIEYKNIYINLYKIYNSGHMIAKDQPEIAFLLFKQFLQE